MKLTSLLPFMDKEEIKNLAKQIASGEVQGVKLTYLFPFLDRDDLDEIVNELIDQGKTKEIYSALPFLKKATIESIYERIQKGELEGFKEEALLPFLGSEKISAIFQDVIQQAMKNAKEAVKEATKNVDVDDLFDEDDDDDDDEDDE